jgi:hypothetical protein
MSRSVKSGAAVVCRSCQTLERAMQRHDPARRTSCTPVPASLQHRKGLPQNGQPRGALSQASNCSSTNHTCAQSRHALPRSFRALAHEEPTITPVGCDAKYSAVTTLRGRQQHQSVEGASRRRAAPCSQSVEYVGGHVSNTSRCSQRRRSPHIPVSQASQEGVGSVCLPDTRPNPSIEGTHNGGARCPASSRAAPPLCAPHVKR